MATQNKALIFKKIPDGNPVPGVHLTVENRPIDLATASIPEDGVIVKNHYISFDPFQRGKLRDPSIKSYTPAYEVGSAITNAGVSTIVKSANAKFQPGDLVFVQEVCPIEEYSVLPGPVVSKQVRKLDNPHNIDVKHYLGALGMPGLTAYSSLKEIAHPKAGETMFVSSASGAVGQLAGQIAKREGMRVIGSVGDDAKLQHIIDDLGFDGGFNYKKEKPAEALKRLASDGVDVYFDNVGGEQLEAAINAMNPFGRVVVCGMISQYSLKPSEMYPIRNLVKLVSNRITMRGFIVRDPDFGLKHFRDHQADMGKWLAEGSMKARVHVTQGIDKAAEGLVGMLEGKNFGKAVLQISDPGEQ